MNGATRTMNGEARTMDDEVRTMNGDQVHRRAGTVNGFHEKAGNDTSAIKLLQKRSITEICERMQQIKEDVSDLLQKLETAKPEKTKETFEVSDKYCDKRKPLKEGALPDKQFHERNSLLTDLYEVAHIRTIYNIFIATLILMMLNTILHDIMTTGTTHVGIATIAAGFAKFSVVVEIWFLMFLSSLAAYVAFNFWGHQRSTFVPKSFSLKIWDYSCLTLFIAYQVTFIVLPAKTVIKEDLPVVSSTVVLMEQVRMVMKTHAFVRSSAPRLLSYKPHTETAEPTVPGFSKFLYFMFAPTLVYRDSYPRTKEIRWKVVVWSYTEVLLTIFYIAFLFERLIFPAMIQSLTFPLELNTVLLYTFSMVLPGIMITLCGFYCLLHAWMNGSAEIVRFADRLFYKDWWNATSYAGYYRTWNVVVHDWLYNYIYKDIYEIMAPGSKVLSTCTVFCISALFHEYILACAFRFFYPVLLVMFGGFGFAFVFVSHRGSGNIFLWLTLCLGSGMLVSLYTIEYFARMQCEPNYDSLLDIFVPRSWFCTPTLRT